MKTQHAPMIIAGIFCVLALLGIGSSVYFYREYKASEKQVSNPQDVIQTETLELMKKVGKLMIIPQEVPQVMTVADVETLKKTQVFFQDALSGDLVLVFPNAKKAVLYRPTANVIVNVAPVKNREEQVSDAGQLSALGPEGQAIHIAIRNGSGIVGIAQMLESQLKTIIPKSTIVEKDNAKRMDYEKTLVIPVSELLDKTIVQQLANELSASVSALPSGEPKPVADILIIAGKDRK